MVAISYKRDACNVMCGNNIEENENMYKSMKNAAKKSVSKAIKERALSVLKNCQNGMLREEVMESCVSLRM